MNDDITPGDVERVRDNLMDELEGRLDEKGAEYRAGYIDAVIEMDLGLTQPELFEDQP